MDCNNPDGPEKGLKAPSALRSPWLAFILMVPISISQAEDSPVRHTVSLLGFPCRLTKHLKLIIPVSQSIGVLTPRRSSMAQ